MQGKINKRLVDSINPAGHDEIVWDTEVRGFGLRCRAGGEKRYILKYRTRDGRQR